MSLKIHRNVLYIQEESLVFGKYTILNPFQEHSCVFCLMTWFLASNPRDHWEENFMFSDSDRRRDLRMLGAPLSPSMCRQFGVFQRDYLCANTTNVFGGNWVFLFVPPSRRDPNNWFLALGADRPACKDTSFSSTRAAESLSSKWLNHQKWASLKSHREVDDHSSLLPILLSLVSHFQSVLLDSSLGSI